MNEVKSIENIDKTPQSCVVIGPVGKGSLSLT